MNQLKKFHDDAEARRHAPVREYHAILAAPGFPDKLDESAPAAEKYLSINRKLAARIETELPIAGIENLPPWLKEHIGHLHRDFVRPVRDRLASLPLRMRECSEKIKSAKPEDFKSYSPETLAKLDLEQCNSLMSELRWLATFPENVAAEEAVIREWLDSPYGGQKQHAAPPPPQFVGPRPIPANDPDEPYVQDWDARS